MPKVAMATEDALTNTRQQLLAAIEEVKRSAKHDVSSKAESFEVTNLREELNSSNETTQQGLQKCLEDAQAHAEKGIEALSSETNQLVTEIKASQEQSREEIAAKLVETDEDLRRTFTEELTALVQRLEEEFVDVRNDYQKRIEEATANLEARLTQSHNSLSSDITTLRTESTDHINMVHKEAMSGLEACTTELREKNEAREKDIKSLQDESFRRLDALNTALEENCSRLSTEREQADREIMAQLMALKEQSEEADASLERSVAQLFADINVVSHVSTRRVEWLLPAATVSSAVTEGGGPNGRSIFSPRFDAAGATGLQLELRLFPQQAEGSVDCGVFLWASGIHIAFRISIGSKNATLEKVFGEFVGQGSKKCGALRDHINKDDGTLRLSVELLELIRELGKQESESQWRAQKDSESERVVEGSPLFEGSLVCHRHINNRVLPQVRREVEAMKARMINRIEWLVEEASLLPQCFPSREAICSPTFNAAGVEGMQFIFYPSGYTGATASFCSLFLYCPAGVIIKCHLSAGGQKREVTHTYEEAGAFGRTNFCRLESCINNDNNTILLALDVEDIQQEMRAATTHAFPSSGRKVADPGAGGIDSTIKLSRRPGDSALQDIKLIPSLWSSKGFGDLPEKQEGFNTFKALKENPKLAKIAEVPTVSTSTAATRGRVEAVPRMEPAAAARSQSPVAFSSRSLQSDNSLPLLNVAGPTARGGGSRRMPMRGPVAAKTTF